MKYQSKDELQTAVDLYFATDERPTLAGLALALEINRQTLYNYAEKDEFLDIVKKARERVEAKYEGRLIYDNNPTGVIFALKNMGWRDKTEVENTGNMTLTWNEEKTYANPIDEIKPEANNST